MIEKLAKQTAIYGISTIVGRFLSYLLTPYFTRIFGKATYGIVTDIYALIPFALVLLSMGFESGYFRFATRAEEAGGDVRRAKNRLYATTATITSLAALLFCALVLLNLHRVAAVMGQAYVEHPEYVAAVAMIILFDVMACIPFSRLREQGRSGTFVALKLLNVVLNVALAFGFGFAGLYDTDFGVGWVFVANLASSAIIWPLVLIKAGVVLPRIDTALLSKILTYSMPLLLSGLAATGSEFLDRQMIKYIVPQESMAELGLYGAITKIAVVMVLFTQMYRLAAEPFFLAGYNKDDFIKLNAEAMKYFMLVSVVIFLGIAMFRDLFALIVGADFREGTGILPVILAANVAAGMWLNLSFWYKREEKTKYALRVTLAGLAVTLTLGFFLIRFAGYRGAAWARLASEATMVVISLVLNRKYFPTPYDWRRIGEYVAVGAVMYCASEAVLKVLPDPLVHTGVAAVLFAAFIVYAVRRENIDVKGLVRAVMHKFGI